MTTVYEFKCDHCDTKAQIKWNRKPNDWVEVRGSRGETVGHLYVRCWTYKKPETARSIPVKNIFGRVFDRF